jgi:divinyl chlorophyllide a 8-vinyl-reductase
MTRALRVLLLGGTGTIGRATAAALLAAGHRVTAQVRPGSSAPPGTEAAVGDAASPGAVAKTLATGHFDAIISCIASRTGAPDDAWAVDHAGNILAIEAARAAGAARFVLLSAICVQKPKLAFQHAKLAAEAGLRQSGLDWTIVRPTAFFKSLSGQVARVAAGRPFLVFGDGRLTACKPISDRDLGRFIAGVLTDPASHGRILPIGGPGPAITPRDQAQMLFELTGRPERIRRVPVALMGAAIGALSLAGRMSASAAGKAEFARIGRYYATESMLVWDAARARYDADATPEFGRDRLRDHYAAALRGEVTDDRGTHAVF